jgi:DNA-binding NarL/FixJ family response regulator
MKVLIIDDSAALRRRLIAILLEDDGIDDVAEAFDSTSGLDALEKANPDLVILDLNLPGESGLALLPRLKERAPHVPIIVLTNHSSRQYAERCRQLGADDFLDKSKDFSRLAPLLERLRAKPA